jgi:hypothetical protein
MGVREMSRWAFLGLLAVCAALAGSAAVGSAATASPYNEASDSYYRLDVPNGKLQVTVKSTFQNAQSGALASLPFAMMAGATSPVITQDGTPLTTTVTPSAGGDNPAVVVGKLLNPLNPKAKVDLVLTYELGLRDTNYTSIQPGAIETLFLGQGAGSFVFVDVPLSGDNYFDPGCLKTAEQPSDVTSAGFERWVCGDVAQIALNTDNPDVLARCARLDDRCRQRAMPSLFSAFVQSITDTSLRGSLEADVTLQQGPTNVIFKYFRHDEKWATHEMEVAKKALPLLEKVYGFPYAKPTIVIRQSHHIEFIGAAGVAFPDQGEVLVTPDTGFDDEVMVHELAHQWAGSNLDNPWEWEGLAEYGMRTVAASLGITPIDRHWAAFGYKDPLALWGQTENGDADYWYGKAGAFWFAFQEAIGGQANMTAVLAQTSPAAKHAPFDGKWFMDAGERASGANLDSLFLTWVFNPATATSELQGRRDAHNLVATLTPHMTQLGLTGVPTDIQANLDAWVFGGVAAQVTQAAQVLDAYDAVLKMANGTLPPSDAVAKSWGSDTLAHTKALIEDQRQAVEALADATHQLANEPATSPAMKALSESHEAYVAGDFAGAKRLSAQALTDAYNQVAAGKMIDIAKARQASYKQSFLGRIGLLMLDPEGDLAQAEADYAAGSPDTALKLSRGAYDAWDGASARGLQRLAFIAGAMCALSFAVWWLLRRIDGGGKKPSMAARMPGAGHVLDAPDGRKQGWRDWENNQRP